MAEVFKIGYSGRGGCDATSSSKHPQAFWGRYTRRALLRLYSVRYQRPCQLITFIHLRYRFFGAQSIADKIGQCLSNGAPSASSMPVKRRSSSSRAMRRMTGRPFTVVALSFQKAAGLTVQTPESTRCGKTPGSRRRVRTGFNPLFVRCRK